MKTPEQAQRVKDLFEATYEKLGVSNPLDFLIPRRGRSISSIEEEMFTYLPMFEEHEIDEIQEKALALAERKGVKVNTPEFWEALAKNDKELFDNTRVIGLVGIQYKLLQDTFSVITHDLFKDAQKHFFEARYEAINAIELGPIKAACLEEYAYSPAISYRSMLYHMMRHMTNLDRLDTISGTISTIRQTLEGKRILELGCGPGFFLHMLNDLGAEVTGVEMNDSYKNKVDGINIVYGDAKNLSSFVHGSYDVVISKDFLSLAVTKDDAGPIMAEAFKVTREGGFSFHQIDYGKMDEKKYLEMISHASGQGLDEARIRQTWEHLPADTKEMLLYKNILNISLDHLADIGYKPLTQYKYCVDKFLTIALQK